MKVSQENNTYYTQSSVYFQLNTVKNINGKHIFSMAVWDDIHKKKFVITMVYFQFNTVKNINGKHMYSITELDNIHNKS